jgi:hypothetical protein
LPASRTTAKLVQAGLTVRQAAPEFHGFLLQLAVAERGHAGFQRVDLRREAAEGFE